MAENSYSQLMIEGRHYIELKLELSEPAELYDLVGAFTAIADQFEQYIRDEHPNLVDGKSRIYVKEIRAGSIIADLIPFIEPLIRNMDSALIVDDFIRRYGGMLQRLFRGDKVETATRNDLDDFMRQVAVIANDPDGKSAISSVEFHQTARTTRASVTFDTKEATRAQTVIESHRREIEAKAYEVHKNVLLVFWQSNVKDVETGRRSGERATVEAVSDKPLAVVYDSELAEARIKHETRDGERNLYKLGFYVTLRVEKLRGNPVAYRIEEVHDIIELPD